MGDQLVPLGRSSGRAPLPSINPDGGAAGRRHLVGLRRSGRRPRPDAGILDRLALAPDRQAQVYAVGGTMEARRRCSSSHGIPSSRGRGRLIVGDRHVRCSTGTSRGSGATPRAGRSSGASSSGRACVSSRAARSAVGPDAYPGAYAARSPIRLRPARSRARACRCSSGGASPTRSWSTSSRSRASSSGSSAG